MHKRLPTADRPASRRPWQQPRAAGITQRQPQRTCCASLMRRVDESATGYVRVSHRTRELLSPSAPADASTTSNPCDYLQYTIARTLVGAVAGACTCWQDMVQRRFPAASVVASSGALAASSSIGADTSAHSRSTAITIMRDSCISAACSIHMTTRSAMRGPGGRGPARTSTKASGGAALAQRGAGPAIPPTSASPASPPAPALGSPAAPQSSCVAAPHETRPPRGTARAATAGQGQGRGQWTAAAAASTGRSGRNRRHRRRRRRRRHLELGEALGREYRRQLSMQPTGRRGLCVERRLMRGCVAACLTLRVVRRPDVQEDENSAQESKAAEK